MRNALTMEINSNTVTQSDFMDCVNDDDRVS